MKIFPNPAYPRNMCFQEDHTTCTHVSGTKLLEISESFLSSRKTVKWEMGLTCGAQRRLFTKLTAINYDPLTGVGLRSGKESNLFEVSFYMNIGT